jgi:cell division protein FtsI/penicillin-binding protein 2|tara:strand:+ start:1114 stop:2385 length:1272 start_codon:yes stop_codon:yes gene_type:complete
LRYHRGYDHSKLKYIPKSRRFPLIRIILVLASSYILYNYFSNASKNELNHPVNPVQIQKTGEFNLQTEVKVKKSEITATQPLKKASKVPLLPRQPDEVLGKNLLNVLSSQKPYRALYLMVDGTTGRILAWGQQNKFKASVLPTYLPNSSFPAASLVKIVTAAAALESRRYSNHTLIPSIGRSVTLYKRQLKVPKNYNGRKISLEKAFASSMNPPMGIVGLNLGGNTLRKTAEKLGFNRDYADGIPAKSNFKPPDKGFGVAEAASGFTTDITISPLLAAAIVRSVLQRKAPEIPWSPVVGTEYAPKTSIGLPLPDLTENTYYGLNRMFEATVKRGSARRVFKNRKVLFPYNRKRLRIGGKTGTKEGVDGYYQWFAGFAKDKKDPKKSIILVCLHINELKGTRASPPAQAAGLLINHWAKKYLKW